ncbi:circadian clock protein KaiC [soil metagenome]
MNAWKPGSIDPSKARTGIEGFDEITRGGLPRGRTTLIEGGPGSGKTILSLQSLVSGARLDGDPGIFVAFEESSERISMNAAKFGWDLAALQKKKLFMLNVQPRLDLIQSGTFDLCGMLAALEAKTKQMKARRIVFDAIDVLLVMLKDPAAVQREMYRLHEWLLEQGLTAIITSKAGANIDQDISAPQMGFMQFMVDCAVLLNHEVVNGVSERNLRVLKYRGSSFGENEAPFLIGATGVEVAGSREITTHVAPMVTTERVSSGVARLDAMLGGGYYRGASVLITGFPGTAKSTLAGAFAEASAARGERTLLISFDSDAQELVRNLLSVGIRLERFVKKGVLRLASARAVTNSAEVHLMQIKNLAHAHKARCVIIDPVSALLKSGSMNASHNVAERLIDWAKTQGITLLCTSLVDNLGAQAEGTPMQISTLADTWIQLNYHIHAGERNRGLSIVKSRGTAHSNQVRELILTSEGVTLADAYTAGGAVLMGTLRWEKENLDRAKREDFEVLAKQKRATLASEEALLEVRLKAVQLELVMKRAEAEALGRLTAHRNVDLARGQTHLDELRGAERK